MFQGFFDKEAVKKDLKQMVGATIYSRGFSYFKEGLVGKVKVAPLRAGNVKILAHVLGSDEYTTQIIFNLKKSRLEASKCNCPYGDGDCKHVVALSLAFFELYEEFCGSYVEYADIADLKNDLASQIKNFKNNEIQGWEGEYYEDEDDDEYIDGLYDDENEIATTENAAIKDAEIISDKKNIQQNYSSEDLLALDLKSRLKAIGIDAEKIPDFIIKELEKKVGVGTIKTGQQIQSDKVAKTIVLGESFLKKYCLVLDIDYLPKIELHEKNRPTGSYWSVRPMHILNQEKNNITPKQNELLAYLARIESLYYEKAVEWGALFGLIEDCEIEIFLNRKDVKNRLRFGADQQKIEAQLYVKENEEYHSGEMIKQDDLIFKLKGGLIGKKDVKFFSGADAFVIIENFQLKIFPTHKALSVVVSRILNDIRSSHYGYHDQYSDSLQWETTLRDEEIIKINEIIFSAKQSFEFENNLSEEFKVNKFKKIGPAILVDYDNENNFLKLRAIIDYGFAKIDVGHTIYKSMSSGIVSFKKRYSYGGSREKYHLEIKEDKINYAKIDSKAEAALFKKFSEDEACGFSRTVRCVKKGAKQIEHFYDNNWTNIKALGFPIEYVHDKFDFVEENFKADFDVDFNESNDWFSFDVACYCGENKITIVDLQKYIENKQQFLKLADGRILKITNREELEKFVLMLESFYQKEGQKFEGKIYHAPELDSIISGSQYYNSKISKSFKAFMDEAQSGKPVEKVKIPIKIRKPLRDYQKEGIDWFYFLRKYRFGGILADDMGLGKTLQALSLIEMNKVKNKPSLVICPKTLVFNWEDEVTKFFPKMTKLVIDGAPAERQDKLKNAKKYDLIITSYPSVKKDEQFYDKLKFNYCFIDEAQYIKNHKTQNARSVKKIHADYRLALTGTPLENSVSEIWSLFDFLMPGFLGTHNHFFEKFEKPIMKNGDALALESLKKKTACFMLRRTKDKVLKELPPKIEQVSHCQLGKEQNILYQEILANVKKNISDVVEEKGFAKSQIHILAGLTKLRQVCNHPVLLLKDKNYEKYSSAKLEMFLELAQKIVSSGRKVLVFSQFTQMLDILAKELKKQNIDYHYLSGKTNNRKELVADFNSSEKIPVFLISLKAGGTGLNLVSADNVIIFDPWWNPSVENQAIDRAHRIGQKKSVNVYRLIVKGTIEEKIVQLQEKKKSLFDNMVGESNDLFKELTWSDVKELFE